MDDKNYFSVMKAATINELKQELTSITPGQLVEFCLRLAKFKKENKELLTYLLFDAHDVQGYIQTVKKEIDAQMLSINTSNLYFVKKSFRKILRIISKHCKYTQSKQAEIEWGIYFCQHIKRSKIAIEQSVALSNLYQQQLKKIRKGISEMHEDLQYDYLKDVDKLT